MLDPVTVIATASAAYNALKKGIEVGRELQDMGSQLGAWAGAIADIEFMAKKAENPPWFKVGGNIQAEAIEIFAAKKKIEAEAKSPRTQKPSQSLEVIQVFLARRSDPVLFSHLQKSREFS